MEPHLRNFITNYSLMTQMAENLPGIQETPVQSLGWEDPLEEEMATHSTILAWRIPRTEESKGSQRVRHNRAANTHTHTRSLLVSISGKLKGITTSLTSL